MANYRNIATFFWTDAKVDDEFTPEDKYFYLYLLTNPHTNLCGCYEVGKKQMERETGYTWESILRLLDRMENVHQVIKYSAENKEILIMHWYRHNWTRSEKQLLAVESVAKYIKTPEFKQYVFDRVKDKYKEKDNDKEKDKDIDNHTDVSIGYAYGKGTVSDKPIKPKKNAFHNFEERRYDNGKLEDALVNK